MSQPILMHAGEESLKQALRFAFTIIGLRPANFPDANQKEFLHGFILKSYGGHTAGEIRLAFELAVRGELGVEANCYENFSPLYFAGIMNAYRKYASVQASRLERKTAPEPKPRTWMSDLIDKLYWASYLMQRVNKLPYKIPR